jgi:hypothetical protein
LCRYSTDHIGSVGLNGRECKLLFLWSRMLKVDPHTVPKGWAQGAITLVEFIEAIARTADIISLPSVWLATLHLTRPYFFVLYGEY